MKITEFQIFTYIMSVRAIQQVGTFAPYNEIARIANASNKAYRMINEHNNKSFKDASPKKIEELIWEAIKDTPAFNNYNNEVLSHGDGPWSSGSVLYGDTPVRTTTDLLRDIIGHKKKEK